MPEDEKKYTKADLDAAIEAAVKDRLKNANAEIAQLKSKAEAYDAVNTQLQQVQGELATERNANSSYRAAVGAGITKPAIVSVLEHVHRQEMANLPKKDQVAFSDWIGEDGGARSHEATSVYFAKPAAPGDPDPGGDPAPKPGAEGGDPDPSPAAGGDPPPSTRVKPPPPKGAATYEEAWDKMIGGEEYKGANTQKKREMIAGFKREWGSKIRGS